MTLLYAWPPSLFSMFGFSGTVEHIFLHRVFGKTCKQFKRKLISYFESPVQYIVAELL